MSRHQRRLDYHHEVGVFVRANLTTAASINNLTKKNKIETSKETFLALLNKSQEAIAKIEESPNV